MVVSFLSDTAGIVLFSDVGDVGDDQMRSSDDFIHPAA